MRRAIAPSRTALAAVIALLLTAGGVAGLRPVLAKSEGAESPSANGKDEGGKARDERCAPGQAKKGACPTDGEEPPAPDPDPVINDGIFHDLTITATKTGFRAVVAYTTDAPVSGLVRYGTDPAALTQLAVAPGPPDTAQLIILDGLTVGETYYLQIEDVVSGEKSTVRELKAVNAYTDTPAAGTPYTIDLLVQLDAQSLPQEIEPDQALEDVAAGVNVMAERIYDALDGHARIGDVIITDTVVDHTGTVPFGPPVRFTGGPCETPTNRADFLITTAVPFDSHTFGWGIDDPCVPFYVGRLGQLVVPWESDLHLGHVASHELMHYAFGAPDLYDVTGTDTGAGSGAAGGSADCKNLEWDGSLMHNTGGWVGDRWEMTELDRNQTLTPCTHGDAEWTWDVLRERYTAVPEATAPQHVIDTLPRGNADGGALDIRILDREPGSSTLTRITPDDTSPEASNCPPERDVTRTTLSDPAGDATLVLGTDTGQAALSQPVSDILGATAAWTGSGLELTITVDDLTELPAPGSSGEWFDFNVNIGGVAYDMVAEWDRIDPTVTEPSFRATVPGPTGRVTQAILTGTWDMATDTITINVPESVPSGPAGPGITIAPGSSVRGIEIVARRQVGLTVPDFDAASGGCEVIVPGTPPPPPPPEPKPAPDATLSGGSPTYAWEGGPTTAADPAGLGIAVDRRVIDVAEAGALTVEALASTPEVNDIDIYLYDEAGTEVDSSAAEGGDESFTYTVAAPGRYVIEIVHFLAVEATYTARATLA